MSNAQIPAFGMFVNALHYIPNLVVAAPYTGYVGEYYLTLTGSAPVDVVDVDFGQGPLDVLDLCCGAGRWATILARQGHRVVGVDRSPDMLAHTPSISGHIEYRLADVRGLEQIANFDRVILGGRALLEFPPKEQYNVLEKAAMALRAGGRILIEVATPDAYYPDDQCTVLPLPVGHGFAILGTHRDATTDSVVQNLLIELEQENFQPTRLLSGLQLFPVSEQQWCSHLQEVGLHNITVRRTAPHVLTLTADQPHQ